MFPIVKLNNGLYIDGTRINTVRVFKVDSSVEALVRLLFRFYVKLTI